jgi:hypothetical protein
LYPTNGPKENSMKTWFITLSLLGAAGFAHADGMPSEPAAEAESAVAQMQAQTGRKASSRKPARLPRGDLRHCLELGSNEAIIRCAEKPLKR